MYSVKKLKYVGVVPLRPPPLRISNGKALRPLGMTMLIVQMYVIIELVGLFFYKYKNVTFWILVTSYSIKNCISGLGGFVSIRTSQYLKKTTTLL